jgi:hypothetical protein
MTDGVAEYMERNLGISPSMSAFDIVEMFAEACGEVISNKATTASVTKQPLRRSTRQRVSPVHLPGMLTGSAAKIDLRVTRQINNWTNMKTA